MEKPCRAPPDLDEQRRKIESANAWRIRHKRVTRTALLLVILLSAVSLTLAVKDLWAGRAGRMPVSDIAVQAWRHLR